MKWRLSDTGLSLPHGSQMDGVRRSGRRARRRYPLTATRFPGRRYTGMRPAMSLPGSSSKARRAGRTGKGKELDVALELIDPLSGPWDPSRYHDTYQ
ncbi:hypothetical protein GCM10010256_73350 [Streptomyces coeruleorubidus]|nr:hypothetical protein GCM10010256_73350 [Streptomyces coeruleorubidus]